ncbi:hypothetical protein [Pelagicoccus mobilis]|uniref:Uncharacterized protein n=1 Tax=Pelagicoccus mobilis TaxID=415221 RepID=A0A934VLL5_9BACT|nr:hypothetical protein [Pelagicoccus mobilis]MBK1877881.1 hypothetical protein [Pelagicoccus mobilis]
MKRVKFGQAGVTLESALQVTPHFAQLGEFKVIFENRAQQRRDAALQSALDADIEYAQAKLDQMNAADPSTPISGKPERMSNDEFSAELADVSDTSEALRDSLFERGGQVADTVFLSLEIFPDMDMRDAYAAVILYHDSFDKEGSVSGRIPIISIEKVGDLKGGASNPLSLDLSTKEQFIQNLEFQFYLFANDGTPVATNASSSLQEINQAEREYIQNKLSKGKLR